MNVANRTATVIAAAILAAHVGVILFAVRGELAPALWLCRIVTVVIVVFGLRSVWRVRKLDFDGRVVAVCAVELGAFVLLTVWVRVGVVWTVLIAHTLLAVVAAVFLATFRMKRLF